ncbi:MlaD family protein [Nocardia higoensis]|nr:MlaD family protein [Nocardia higoensis]
MGSAVALLLILVIGLGYLLLGALRLNPFRSAIEIKVHLAESGGLLVGQDATYRGIRIGRVVSIGIPGDHVVATVSIDGDIRIPADSQVRVAGLSAAGEQYLDFRPSSAAGPYLTDGSEIGPARTETPIGLAELLEDLHGTSRQIDVGKVQAMLSELTLSAAGGRKLADILDGGIFLISTVDSVLPQTVSVVRNSKVILGTPSIIGPGLPGIARNLSSVLGGVSAMDGGFRQLLDSGPGTMAALDTMIADNSPTMVQLLGNLTTIAQLSYLRVPALEALFPNDRGSMLEAVTSMIHDGGVWALGDPYPKFSCDYGVPRGVPSEPSFPEPYLWTYCQDIPPGGLVRGAANAPRPPEDDTSRPPPGVDPLQRADPTPVGPNTVPTPRGGPELPVTPPR